MFFFNRPSLLAFAARDDRLREVFLVLARNAEIDFDDKMTSGAFAYAVSMRGDDYASECVHTFLDRFTSAGRNFPDAYITGSFHNPAALKALLASDKVWYMRLNMKAHC